MQRMGLYTYIQQDSITQVQLIREQRGEPKGLQMDYKK